MSQRVKGQETKLVLSGPNGAEEGLFDVRSFEAELDIETLEEGYLGETANRFDDIYNGTSGNAEAHIENRLYLDFIGRVVDRSQRRLPADTQFNAVSAFAMPNGTRQRLLFQDIFFGPIQMRAASRKDYVIIRWEWKCSNLKRIG